MNLTNILKLIHQKTGNLSSFNAKDLITLDAINQIIILNIRYGKSKLNQRKCWYIC